MNDQQKTHSEYAGEQRVGAKVFRGRGPLGEIVQELERQRDSRIDFCDDARNLQVVVNKSGGLNLAPNNAQSGEFLPDEGLPVMHQSLPQIGERVRPKVPTKFARAMAEQRPQLAADMLTGLMAETGNRNLVRCLDGEVRAFLSDRYRVMDNYDLAFASLNAVKESGGDVIECNLTDRHLRLKFVSRDVWDVIDQVRHGDSKDWYAGGLGNQQHLSRVAARTKGDLPGGPGTVYPLVTVSNSETGHGGMNVRIGIMAGICFNLATVENVVTQVHLGQKLDTGIFTEETIAADSQTIMLKDRDAIHAAFVPEKFKALVARVREAASEEVGAPSNAVDNVIEHYNLAEGDRDAILSHFLRDYDTTRYGLAQAVARTAQDTPDADKAQELEDAAGKIMVAS